jgi:hypothetical protein
MDGDGELIIRLVRQPAFIKLDVEGHELSVIKGMRKLLSSPEMYAILCEVHFSLLEENGIKNAAHEIQRCLKDCGLVHQKWISRSHLLARRY